MYTYALIDHGPGYVWGAVEAADPLEACHRLDAELGAGNDRGYEISRPDFCNESGYHVYRAPAGFGGGKRRAASQILPAPQRFLNAN